jgi:hypothetical protein
MTTERRVNADTLKKLGFSDDLITEAIRREERGVLSVEPPPDLVQRTMSRVAHLFEMTPQENPRASDTWRSILDSLKMPDREPDPVRFFAAATTVLCNQYTRSVGHALTARERPLVILENHNLVHPNWRYSDPIFKCLRDAAGTVNRTVAERGVDPAAIVVMLKPRLIDYTPDEVDTLVSQIRDATSDLWWMKYDPASAYANADVIVIGEEALLKIDVKAASPFEAFESMKTATNPDLARRVRQEVLGHCVAKAMSIKVGGHLQGRLAAEPLTRKTVRDVLESVIG